MGYFFLGLGDVLIVSTIDPALSRCASFTGLNFPEPASRPIFFVAIRCSPRKGTTECHRLSFFNNQRAASARSSGESSSNTRMTSAVWSSLATK